MENIIWIYFQDNRFCFFWTTVGVARDGLSGRVLILAAFAGGVVIVVDRKRTHQAKEFACPSCSISLRHFQLINYLKLALLLALLLNAPLIGRITTVFSVFFMLYSIRAFVDGT